MSITITQLRTDRLAVSNAIIAYVSVERDLFKLHGQHAERHLDDDDRRRLARLAHAVGWSRMRKHARLVTLSTLRRWWQRLIAAPPEQPRHGGRQPVAPETVLLVLEMARDNGLGNDAWGRIRIAGELQALGIAISDSTVRRIMKRHGLPPAPERGRSWEGPAAVAASHPDTVAIDFTHVTIGCGAQAQAYHLLAGIHLGTRDVEILGLTQHPNRDWVAQVARNITMSEVGFLHRVGAKAVLMDRDLLFTIAFRHTLRTAGFRVHRTPRECPWCNGYIERFWQTLKNGIVRKCIWMDEQALWKALVEFTHEHYRHERPHQGLGNRPPMPLPETPPDLSRPIVRHDRLGGLIRVYRRAA